MLNRPYSEYAEKAFEKQIAENKRVVVRVWTSALNLSVPGHSVGHVSIEIPKKNIYWSLWPRQKPEDDSRPSAKEEEGLGIISPISTEKADDFTYQKDLNFEGREPELVYCFYTLEVVRMQSRFDDLCKSNMGWNMVGRLFCANAGSCASSAWDLLEAGNINRLVTSLDQSSVSSRGGLYGASASSKRSAEGVKQELSSQRTEESALRQAKFASLYSSEMSASPFIKSPDFIGELLKQAKANELKENPITRDISFEGETSVEVSSMPSSRWRCNIL